jgi:hypothetical protein
VCDVLNPQSFVSAVNIWTHLYYCFYSKVPTNKAEATFAFMKAWIEGSDLPRYDKDCVVPKIAVSTELLKSNE